MIFTMRYCPHDKAVPVDRFYFREECENADGTDYNSGVCGAGDVRPAGAGHVPVQPL